MHRGGFKMPVWVGLACFMAFKVLVTSPSGSHRVSVWRYLEKKSTFWYIVLILEEHFSVLLVQRPLRVYRENSDLCAWLTWSKASLRKPLSTSCPSWRRLQEGKEAALKAATEDVADVRIVSQSSEPSARPTEADSTSASPLSWLSAAPPFPPCRI